MLIPNKLPNSLGCRASRTSFKPRFLVPLIALAALALTSAPALAAPRASHSFAKTIGHAGSGPSAEELSEPAGVAVNESKGLLYVADLGNDRVDEFETNGTFVRAWGGGVANGEAKLETCTSPCQKGISGANPGEFERPESIAVDNDPTSPSFGDVYVVDGAGHGVVDKFTATGAYINQLTETPAYTAVLHDGVQEYLQEVASGPLGGPVVGASHIGSTGPPFPYTMPVTGIGVATGATGDVWVEQRTEGLIFIPRFSNGQRNVYTSARVGYKVLSQGFAVDANENYYLGLSKFGEFGEHEQTIDDNGELSTGLAVELATGSLYVDNGGTIARFSSEGVFDERFGTSGELQSGTGLAVTDTGDVYVAEGATGLVDVYENKPGAPGVEAESFANVSALNATLSASVNTYGLSTTYTIEYGPSETYGSVAKTGTIPGTYNGAVTVSAMLEGLLQPETTYHFRVVAHNADGTEPGGDVTFTTLGDSPGLPDGRGFEMVSPVDNADGDVYPPGRGSYGAGVHTALPMRAAAEGDAVEYVADPPKAGGNGQVGEGSGNEYVATRVANGGWSTVDLETLGLNKAPFEAPLSNDLTNSGTSTVPARTYALSEGKGDILEGGGTQERELKEDVRPELEEKRKLEGEARKLKEEGNEGQEEQEDVNHAGRLPLNDKLYQSAGGRSSFVAVLPNGKVAPDATFGGQGQDFSRVISTDGSRVFWTDLEEGPVKDHVFVRENGDETAAVSMGPAQLWTASPDGHYAFYTEDEELWRFDLETEAREDLSGAGAGVLGVVGVNETGGDGSYVYFLANGVLGDGAAHGASSQTCTVNHNGTGEGSCNLYVLHGGVTTFIAVIAGEELGEQEADGISLVSPNLEDRPGEVSTDGRALVFQSRANLTGYDNLGCEVESGGFQTLGACREAYVYDADTGEISCVSCNPTGAPPIGAPSLPGSLNSSFMRRWISEDGDRVFFESSEGLAEQDTNGVQDVYEWEREGDGSCAPVLPARSNGGCIYLLSGGTSSANSYLLDASASGDDVFIISRAHLTPQDKGETYELYDARVGATEPPSEQACTGTGCQGLPSAPPPFATPSSVTFNGIGNFPPPAPMVVKPTKQTVKCPKGKARNKHNQCVKVKTKKKNTKARKSASNDRRTSR